jgi:hypothetical protein
VIPLKRIVLLLFASFILLDGYFSSSDAGEVGGTFTLEGDE